MIYIEHEGALYRGPARGVPTEVWSRRDKKWKPYQGTTPKPVDWGEKISEQEAHAMMDA